MTEVKLGFIEQLQARFADKILALQESQRQITLEVSVEQWLDVMRTLRDAPEFRFEQLIDICGVDYLGYGQVEWDTSDVSSEGFSRGVEGAAVGRFKWQEESVQHTMSSVPGQRFAVVAHVLSVHHNRRLRLRCFAENEMMPIVPSLVDIWPVAHWFEREAFDLFGILFEGHPDLRRLLTDYGFIGHPFRKDFPLIGNVEVRYDASQGRVIYEPVSIEPRVLVPRTVRDDSRYLQGQAEQNSNQAQ